MNGKVEWKKIIEKLKKKENLLVVILAGVLLMVISLPTEEKKGWEEETKQTEPLLQEDTSSVKELEKRLEKILSNVEGVGEVQVMITLKSNGEKVVEKDRESSESVVKEQASETEKTESHDITQKETTVTYSQESGNGEPYVIKELEPEIEGVLVIAQGGDSPTVAKNISEAILALFPVDAHKIKVMKSVNQSSK